MDNSKLKDYIKELSKKDKKNLTQKSLKVCEEAGELAKVILPFENAFATNHRFVDRKKILEEIVDVYLTSISIYHDLDFTEEEFNEMLNQKTLKWANLQKKEMILADKIPYEIHVTVSNVDKTLFKKTCESLSVKPIILDLQNTDGKTVFEDVMTSSVFFGNNRTAYDELQRIVKGLSSEGINVVREKIETIPWHPAAPSKEGNSLEMPKDCYFETHYSIVASEKDLSKLKEIAKKHNAHLSRNVFKKIDKDSFKIMMTYRSYDDYYEKFLEKINMLKNDLQDFVLDKEIVEFSVYDTQINHDSSWLKKK